MNEEDRQQLLDFTYRVEQDIPRALEYATFDEQLRDVARAAWRALVERGEFELVREALESGEHDSRLDANGLSGVELHFKLRLVDAAREAVDREERDPEPDTPDPEEPRSRPRGRLRRLLRKLLESTDVVLNSLVDALTGRGEAIKEIKEAVGIGLDD